MSSEFPYAKSHPSYTECNVCGETYIVDDFGCQDCIHKSSFFCSNRKPEYFLPLIIKKIKNKELDCRGNLATIDYRSAYGYTLLMRAAGEGETKLVELLLRLGADINATDIRGYDALIMAAENLHFFTFEKLIILGANHEYVSQYGESWKTVIKDNKKVKELEKFIVNEMTSPKPAKK